MVYHYTFNVLSSNQFSWLFYIPARPSYFYDIQNSSWLLKCKYRNINSRIPINIPWIPTFRFSKQAHNQNLRGLHSMHVPTSTFFLNIHQDRTIHRQRSTVHKHIQTFTNNVRTREGWKFPQLTSLDRNLNCQDFDSSRFRFSSSPYLDVNS